MGKLAISMTSFNSYVKLPEGTKPDWSWVNEIIFHSPESCGHIFGYDFPKMSKIKPWIPGGEQGSVVVIYPKSLMKHWKWSLVPFQKPLLHEHHELAGRIVKRSIATINILIMVSWWFSNIEMTEMDRNGFSTVATCFPFLAGCIPNDVWQHPGEFCYPVGPL